MCGWLWVSSCWTQINTKAEKWPINDSWAQTQGENSWMRFEPCNSVRDVHGLTADRWGPVSSQTRPTHQTGLAEASGCMQVGVSRPPAAELNEISEKQRQHSEKRCSVPSALLMVEQDFTWALLSGTTAHMIVLEPHIEFRLLRGSRCTNEWTTQHFGVGVAFFIFILRVLKFWCWVIVLFELFFKSVCTYP